MKNRTLTTGATLAAGTLVATALAMAPAHAEGTPDQHRAGTMSLAEVLAADGTRLDDNWKDFDIVEAAALTIIESKPDSPVALLTDGKVRLTAFVPTDAAFRKLVADLTGKRPSTERRTVTKLLGIADVDTLEAVLLYHVVPEATLTSPRVVAAAEDRARLTTAQGGKVQVRTIKGRLTLVDKDRDDRDPRVVTSAIDINRGNRQVAHGIDRVLRPGDL